MNEREQRTVLYHHTQRGYFVAIALGLATATQAGSLARALREHKPRAWVYVLVIGASAALACAFSSLTTEITHDSLSVAFRRGFLRRSVRLEAIRRVEQVVVPWYWGWGLRLTPKGWLYRVQGREAVRVELVRETSILIGTNEPGRLAATIEAIRPEP